MKNRLPNVIPYAPSEVQMDVLSQWLAERDAPEPSVEDLPLSSEADQTLSVPTHPYDSEVESGQIRLAAPDGSKTGFDFLYFAVLKKWDDEDWLVAPFSRYSVPAISGELSLQRADTHLRAICLWNARTISEATIQESWVEGCLTAKEQVDVWSVFRHVMTCETLSLDLSERVGARVVRADDPRVEYQNEEAHRMNRLQERTPSVVHDFCQYRAELFEEIDIPMAAADGDSVFSKFVIVTSDGVGESSDRGVAKQEQLVVDDSDGSIRLTARWWVDTTRTISSGVVFLNHEVPFELELLADEGGVWVDLSAEISEKLLPHELQLELILLEAD